MSKIHLLVAENFHNQHFEVVFHERSSSMRGHLHSMCFLVLVWSHKLKFKIWARSDQWLLRYSAINILRLSSIQGHLPCMVIFILCIFQFCFGHMSLSLKFEQYPMSGCWDIPQSIFWGCLPFKVIFHAWSSSFYVFFNFSLVT